jgi:hypothetical protein
MNISINSILRSIVCASIATALSGVLAWMVIDSTTNGPHYDASVQIHALGSQRADA